MSGTRLLPAFALLTAVYGLSPVLAKEAGAIQVHLIGTAVLN